MNSSAKIPRPRFNAPQTASCPTENDMDSNLEAYLPTTMTWNVQKRAPASSMKSPARTSNRPPVERKNAPTPASTTATMEIQCTFSRQIRNNTIGTKTTYKLVINPALPAVVYTIPSCWSALPRNNTNPAMNIHLY